ncbi:MAG: hypothetical protein GYB64_09660, partial [Chloroflexi bacterium]|nr:hypothetical protein [Chloroflexota bacterium]
KRGMMRRWNVILVILTYLLVIFGTFATRSGFVSSVHSFAQSAIGPLFFVFLAGAVIASVAVVINKWDTLQADNELEHIVSRETAFLLNNVVFTAIALTVFVGTYWSVFTEILSGFTPVERSTLGPAYFNRSTGPMFVVLLFLMGVAPLIAWKKASIKRLGKAIVLPVAGTLVTVTVLGVLGVRQPGALIGLGMAIFAGLVTAFEIGRGAQARIRTHDENVVQAVWTLFGRNRRRYGGYLTHFGVVIIAIGIIASSAYQLETQQPLSAGQTITLGDYVLEYNTIERFIATDGRAVTRAVTTVFHNGNEIGQIIPRVDNYPNGQPMSIPGKLMSPLGDDFYVLLVSWEPVSMSSATFKVYYNPLVNWIWGGSLVLMLGTFVTAWPDTKPVKIRQPSRRTAPAAGD